jgi:transcriptional regulator with XRE-family HTH domain
LRESRLLTQQELADRARVHRVTIASLETGEVARLSTVRKLAEALGVDPAELMWEEDPRVVRVQQMLGSDAGMVLKWLIGFYRGAAVGQRMSRDEYARAWREVLPDREVAVLESLIRAGSVIETDNGSSLIPAP